MAQRERTPTKEDLLKLRRWARVALAVRCAQRVQPLFVQWAKNNNLDVRHIEALDNAIAFAHTSALRGHVNLDALAATRATEAAAHAADVYMRVAEPDEVPDAMQAGNAASAARAAVAAAADDPDDAETIDADFRAVAYAAYAADNDTTEDGIWSDYDRLLTLGIAEGWTDESPVDPDQLGPLWPFGKPEEWSDVQEESALLPAIQFEFIIPNDLDVAARAEFRTRIALFYASLSATHVMMGGTGLRILDEAGAAPVMSLDEAPHDCAVTRNRTPEAVMS